MSTAIASPALARDGAVYVGVDGGLLKPSPLNLDFANSVTGVTDAVRIRHKVGYDLDAVVGYDFGMFRLEAEVGYKHSDIKTATIDRLALTQVGAANNPQIRYNSTGADRVTSGMINGLIDIGPEQLLQRLRSAAASARLVSTLAPASFPRPTR